MRPVFSIIVPIYGVEKYLKKCIESILNQTFQDFELILVDDGSKDECPSICDKYAEKDKRIYVIHKKNEGLVSARNTGLKQAKGQYICYVDGDDWISEVLLETVNNMAIQKHLPDIVMFSAVKQFENSIEDIPYEVVEGYYDKNKLQKDIYPYMMYDKRKNFCQGLIFPVAWNKIYKSELIKEHYCKETQIRMGEDNAFVFECLYYAKSLYVIDQRLYYYNQLNTTSITSNYDENRFENNQKLFRYMQQQLGGISETMDEQLNAFKAYWVIMAIFHEVKCGKKMKYSYKHIKEKLKENDMVKNIHLKGLPLGAKCFMILLKFHLYFCCLFGTKLINKVRE